MTTVAEKCARVEKLTVDYPDWWTTNLTDMSIDLLAKLGIDPREEKYFSMHVIQFIRITEALDEDDPDTNAVCNTLAKKLRPTIDFHKLGIQDDIVAEGQTMFYMGMLDDFDDPSQDLFDDPSQDLIDERMYDDY